MTGRWRRERLAPRGRGQRARARRCRRLRRHAAPPRDPAQLPGRRAPALHPRDVRAGAAAVHRHLEQRGATVLARRAQLGLRLRQARDQHRRLRVRQRDGERPRLPDHQARRVPLPAAGARRARRGAGAHAARRQGARRTARPPARVPPAVRRQHQRDELRRAVPAGRRGAQPRRGDVPVPAEHRRGRRLEIPLQRRRADLPDRHRVLRLPRRSRPLQPRAPARDDRQRPGARARDQALAGREARCRRARARGEDDAGDRRLPRRRAAQGLPEPAEPLRVSQRRRTGRLLRDARRRDGAARRDQVGGRRAAVLGRPRCSG